MCTHGIHIVQRVHAAQPQAPKVVQQRPLCAFSWSRVHAAVLADAPDRLRERHRKAFSYAFVAVWYHVLLPNTDMLLSIADG